MLSTSFAKRKAVKVGAAAVCVLGLGVGLTVGFDAMSANAATPAKAVVASCNVTSTKWSFGIISDTQQTVGDDGYNPNSVAANIIKQVDGQMIKSGVKFVVAVGDTADNGGKTSVDTRALYAQDLYNAGIGFYPLRGNHEATEDSGDGTYKNSASEFAYDYPQIGTGVNNKTPLAINTSIIPSVDLTKNAPATKTGSAFQVGSHFSFPTAVNLANNSLSYSFKYGNATFVMLDQFVNQNTNPGDSNDSTIASQQSWINGVLSSRATGTHAFVFTHKNLLGGNHKDNLFGGQVTSADPGDGYGLSGLTSDQQTALKTKQSAENAFIKSMDKNGVDAVISGHDHHAYESVVTSPDGKSSVNQLICASDSTKFYTPTTPVSANDTPIRQDLGRVGYYIVTVDGPEVTIDYYGDTTGNGYYGVNGGTFNFVKMTSSTYSLNGTEKVIGEGQSYVMSSNTNKAGGRKSGYEGTSMKILAGTNSDTSTTNYGKALSHEVTTGWEPASPSLASDILDLSGMAKLVGQQTDTYALSLSYVHPYGLSNQVVKGGKFCLLTKDAHGKWVKAVSQNFGGQAKFVVGPWKAGDALGTYGVNPVTKTAWAVVNYNGEFAVGLAK